MPMRHADAAGAGPALQDHHLWTELLLDCRASTQRDQRSTQLLQLAAEPAAAVSS